MSALVRAMGESGRGLFMLTKGSVTPLKCRAPLSPASLEAISLKSL